MDKRRVCITAALIILGIVVCLSTSVFAKKRTIAIETASSESREIEDPSVESVMEMTEITASDSSFPVYICGEVFTPGVYVLETPIYLYELIEKAGGLTDAADKDHIDMVYYLEMSQSVYIPSGDRENETDMAGETDQGRWIPQQEKGTSSARRVNINTADESVLSTLSGIGEKTARKIVQYREENGLFTCKEDIMKVPGIGKSKYETIKDSICI